VLDVADRALEMLDGEGLVRVSNDLVVIVAVREARAGRAEGPGIEEKDLLRLVKAAWLRAGQARAWPVPALPPATVGEVDRGGSIREAVVTTWGTRTYETREPGELVPGPSVRLADGRVLGETAVAELLRALAPVFGVELALGEPPPATHPAVTLLDDHADTHSFDAEGTARQRILVVDRGRFVQGVSDASSAPSTGHAARPLTLAPRADHLRLQPGDAELGPPEVETLGPLRSAEARALLGSIVAVGR
jgi:hypothetical protein